MLRIVNRQRIRQLATEERGAHTGKGAHRNVNGDSLYQEREQQLISHSQPAGGSFALADLQWGVVRLCEDTL